MKKAYPEALTSATTVSGSHIIPTDRSSHSARGFMKQCQKGMAVSTAGWPSAVVIPIDILRRLPLKICSMICYCLGELCTECWRKAL